MKHIRVKVCCISSLEEASLAVNAGAAALGLVGHMPSGPGVISDDLIKKIAASTPPPIATFLLTSEVRTTAIITHHRRVETNTIQIVDALEEGNYADLRAQLPGVKLVQVIHVLGEASLDEALSVAPFIDALLLDSGNPNAAVKALGGTGKVHDWSLSRKIREQAQAPVFLAGGLKASNVRAAVEAVEPFGLDLCSGVRTNNQLDPYKLEQFFEALYGL
jgi:phosphoribosylanthranilate isomerase